MNNIDKYVKKIHDRLVKLALRKAHNLQSLLLPYLSQSTASRIDWSGSDLSAGRSCVLSMTRIYRRI